MTTNPRPGGNAGLTPLPAQAAGCHPSVPHGLRGAGTCKGAARCRARPAPLDRNTCEAGAGLPSSKLFPGRPLSWATAPGRCQPPAPLPGAAAGAARGAGPGPWDSISTGTGRGPLVQPQCKKPASQALLGGREGLGAELSFPLVAARAAPCLCGQRLAKSGAGALPKMVKARGAGLAAAQPGRAR